MSTYRVEWPCCGSVTETEAWEPDSCPFCDPSFDEIRLRAVNAELLEALQAIVALDDGDSPDLWHFEAEFAAARAAIAKATGEQA